MDLSPAPVDPPPVPRSDRAAVWLDVALFVATAAGICLAISVFREADARPPDALAYVYGITIAVPLLARRRAPRTVLLVNYGLLLAYYMTGYPAVGFVIPLVVSLATAATAGHATLGAQLVFFGLLGSAGFRLLSEGEAALSVLDDSLRDGALGAAALLFGEAVRSKRALVAATRERLALADQERERETATRVERERVRLARELHDELAHSVTVIGLQADVATEAIEHAVRQREPDLEPVRSAVAAIRGVARDTMTDLRRTLGALRGGPDGDDRVPASGTGALPALLTRAEAAGLTTDLHLDLGDEVVSATVDRTIHRLVQEAVTNTLRHADARHIDVEVAVVGRDIAVTIRDDGRGTSPIATAAPGHAPSGGGHGLLGMRERVLLLEGAFAAGPERGGGFAVRARLPLDAAPARRDGFGPSPHPPGPARLALDDQGDER